MPSSVLSDRALKQYVPLWDLTWLILTGGSRTVSGDTGVCEPRLCGGGERTPRFTPALIGAMAAGGPVPRRLLSLVGVSQILSGSFCGNSWSLQPSPQRDRHHGSLLVPAALHLCFLTVGALPGLPSCVQAPVRPHGAHPNPCAQALAVVRPGSSNKIGYRTLLSAEKVPF